MLKKEMLWKLMLSRKCNDLLGHKCNDLLGHEENSKGVILAATFLFGAGDN